MTKIIESGPFAGWTDIGPVEETAKKKVQNCPFCGKKPEVMLSIFSFTDKEVCSGVVCRNPKCSFYYYDQQRLCIMSPINWNFRPIENALQARIAELEAAINRECSGCWAKDAPDAAQCRLCGLKSALKGTNP